jgi:hypothetical protein
LAGDTEGDGPEGYETGDVAGGEEDAESQHVSPRSVRQQCTVASPAPTARLGQPGSALHHDKRALDLQCYWVVLNESDI